MKLGILGFLIGLFSIQTKIKPDVITQKVRYDSDDPAIWYNTKNPNNSVIFGTDKDTDGSVLAFDLNGKIIDSLCIFGLRRPNNIDIQQNFSYNGKQHSILALTERELKQIRLFSIPDMHEIGNGFRVFKHDTFPRFDLPMGITLGAKNQKLLIFISRKEGPSKGYIHQYSFDPANASLNLTKTLGNFDGKNEIEALCLDDDENILYYSDEGFGVHALNLTTEHDTVFGGTQFGEDHEGIALIKNDSLNLVVVSDQKNGELELFDASNNYIHVASVKMSAKETDGIEILNYPIKMFPKGLLVIMSDNRTFQYYSLNKLINSLTNN